MRSLRDRQGSGKIRGRRSIFCMQQLCNYKVLHSRHPKHFANCRPHRGMYERYCVLFATVKDDDFMELLYFESACFSHDVSARGIDYGTTIVTI